MNIFLSYPIMTTSKLTRTESVSAAITVALLLALAGLPGFPITEELRRTADSINPVENWLSNWRALAYASGYPALMCLTTLWYDSKRLKMAALSMFLFSYLQPILQVTNELFLEPTLAALGMKSFYWSPAAFGIRGILIAIATGAALGTFLNQQNYHPKNRARTFHYVSLCCFAFASWQSCAVGSFGAWATHPEYGDYSHHVKDQMATVQGFFLSGFVSAAIANYLDSTSSACSNASKN